MKEEIHSIIGLVFDKSKPYRIEHFKDSITEYYIITQPIKYPFLGLGKIYYIVGTKKRFSSSINWSKTYFQTALSAKEFILSQLKKNEKTLTQVVFDSEDGLHIDYFTGKV